MSTFRKAVSSLCLMVLVVAAALSHAANVNEFLNFSVPSVPGRLYVPPEAATSAEPRPLILFMHGAGETGTNNSAQVNGNIDNLFDEAKARGAFLYAPQATTYGWTDSTRTSIVMDQVDEALAQYNVDSERLYVTGLSMGGGGVWTMLDRFDDRFAAGVPIAAVSPGGDFDGNNLVGKPTWAFHARNDGTVPTTASQNVVDQILSAASAASITYPARNDLSELRYTNEAVGLNFTEFAMGGHGIWNPVYDTPELYEWLFSKELTSWPALDPAGGAQVIFNNTNSLLPIGRSDGELIEAGTGFVAAGSFALADADFTQANANQLANAFTQFGSSLPMGRGGIEGLFSANLAAPLTTTDPLVGENIYLVVGDGDDMQSSESLFVFKSDELFESSNPSSLATISLDGSLAIGEILLGSQGTVFSNRFGSRDGIVAAPVSAIPEPSTFVALLFASVALQRRDRRSSY